MVPPESGPEAPPGADTIHAFVDGELPLQEAEKVAAYLRENPEARIVADDYAQINDAIRSHSEHLLFEPVPADHVRAVRGRLLPVFSLVAATALLAVGIGAGWLMHAYLVDSSDVVERLAQSSNDVWSTYATDRLHPVEITAADSQQLGAWLANRIGQDVPIPSLEELGLKFLGGRLLTGDDVPAAMLMYEDGGGRRLIVFVSPEMRGDGPTGMHFLRDDAASMMVWANGVTGFGVAGPFSEDELASAAHFVRARFADGR